MPLPVTDPGDTRHLFITFHIEAVENPAETRKAGRPIYEDREMINIKFVGDNKRELSAPAHEKFKRDPATNEWVTYAQYYHRHYDAFKTGEAVKGSGTPLSELPFLTESKRAELKALNVHTAEALAQLDGANLQRLGMYGRSLKNQAEAYIAAAEKSAPFSKLAEENAALTARLAALEAQIAGGKMNLTAQAHIVDPADKSGSPSQPTAQPEEAASVFEPWPDADLRTFIKERTGAAPKGQPAHATLVRLAEEANAKEAA